MRFSLAALTAAILPIAAALPQISRHGKYLYDPNGTRFYLKGIAYQPQGNLAVGTEANEANGGFPEPSDYIDPLSSEANCTRDVPFLKQLGVNSVRVYSVNAANNHDACMKLLEDAGIYVLLDVSLPLNGSIDRSSPSWTTNLLNEYTNTINVFNKYSNVLAYNIGNEVINLASNTGAGPYVKAAARDIKAYLKSINSTALVGYAAVDGDPSFRDSLAAYLTCGNATINVDLYGLNNYEWCGTSTLASSGWNTILSGFQQLTVPTYMSEYGCIKSGERPWTEVAALFSSPVSDVFSGGVAFSYFPTSDGYGMTTINGNTVTTNNDFANLAAAYKNATGPNTPAQSSQTTSELACPNESSSLLASNVLPPTPDESVCQCANQNAFACRVKDTTANRPTIVGPLIDLACTLLGTVANGTGVSCAAIGGNGSTGVYGPLSMCDPATKLNYVMSAYWEANPVDTSCDFDGNATLSNNAPLSPSAAQAAVSSCLAKIPPGGVSTPTAASSPATHVDSTSAAASGTSSSKSGATTIVVSGTTILACIFGAIGVIGGGAAVVM